MLAALLVGGVGCKLPTPSPRDQAKGELSIPPGVAGTVTEFAVLTGGEPTPIHGWGVVVGLGDNGSSEVPETLKKYLVQQMVKYKVGSASAGTLAWTPARMLADKDTAVVIVSGLIPPGAPEGTRFDLRVESLPQSQTVSLDGGLLLTTEMHMASITGPGQVGMSKCLALGRGSIFINPFGEDKQTDQARLRNGTIPNGGTVSVSREIHLELRRPDYRIANMIQDRINSKFGSQEKIASARHPSLVDLKIPSDRRQDYVHFLQVVLHVSLVGAPEQEEAQARRLARAILLPTARGDDIGLTWEAMGRQVLPVVRELYTSDNAAAAYYALRTGLRLGDGLAAEPMMRLAQRDGSPFQIEAVEELGQAKPFLQSTPVLRDLLSSPNELVRVAAYEALTARGSAGLVDRIDVSGQFVVDVVECRRDYVVYVTRTGKPKIVLFGRKIPIRCPVFYCPPDELVTVTGGEKDSAIRVDRKMPRGNLRSEFFEVEPTVIDLVQRIGRLAERGIDGKIEGLGLNYSQVVGVLYGMCKNGSIPAKFVLQRTPELQRMYTSSSGGRPDMPEEGASR